MLTKLMPRVVATVALLICAISVRAQMLPSPTYDSLEWSVANSNVVARGHVDSITPVKTSPDNAKDSLVKIRIDETIKGRHLDAFEFRDTVFDGQRDLWSERKGSLLLFLSDFRRFDPSDVPNPRPDRGGTFPPIKDPELRRLLDASSNLSLRTVYDLDHPGTIRDASGKPIPDSKGLLARARAAAREQKGKMFVSEEIGADRVGNERGGRLRRPKEVPTVPHWGLDPPLRLDQTAAYDGQRILIAVGSDALLVDTTTGKLLRKFSMPNAITAVAFSPEGTEVMTGSQTGLLSLWNIESSKEERTFGPLQSAVNRIEFRATSNYAGERDSFQEDSLVLTACTMKGHTGWGASPDLQTLWNCRTGEAMFIVPGIRAQFSPNRSSILSQLDPLSYSQTWVSVWDLPTAMPYYLQRFALNTPHAAYNWFASAHFSPDCRTLITAEEDGIGLWDASTGAKKALINNPGYKDARFTNDGSKVIAMSASGNMTVFDAASFAPLRELKTVPTMGNSFRNISISLDGHRLLDAWWDIPNGGLNQKGSLWDIDSGVGLAKLVDKPVGFSPDSRTICMIDHKAGTVQVLDAKTGKELRNFTIPTGR